MSLLELSLWCKEQFGPHEVASDPHQRIFDIPWMVLDSARAAAIWNWKPRRSLLSILDEIAGHAEKNPDWLDLTG
jgi:CDP-paratose 2-epimerase